jgi:hypothetical protein
VKAEFKKIERCADPTRVDGLAGLSELNQKPSPSRRVAQAGMPQIDPVWLSDARIVAAYAIFIGSYFVFALGKRPGGHAPAHRRSDLSRSTR